MSVRGEILSTTADGCSRRCRFSRPVRSAPRHDLAARGRRRRPQLGLPLRLGPRCLVHHRGLWVAACPDEANEFFDYLTTSAAGSLERGGDLQIMFGIGGERDLTERELPHLAGWRSSAPVRVGNGAWRQRQLDVYGELLNAVHRLSDHLFDDSHRVGPMADPDKWDEPPELAPATRQFLGRSWPTPPPAVGRKRTTGSGRSGASPATSCTPN